MERGLSDGWKHLSSLADRGHAIAGISQKILSHYFRELAYHDEASDLTSYLIRLGIKMSIAVTQMASTRTRRVGNFHTYAAKDEEKDLVRIRTDPHFPLRDRLKNKDEVSIPMSIGRYG